MQSRSMMISAAMIVAASSAALAQGDAKPRAKAARMPQKAKLADRVRPAVKADDEPTTPDLGRQTSAPQPAHQVTDLAKTLAGTYACTGSFANTGGGTRRSSARMKVSTDLDGAWIAFDITERGGDDAPFPIKLHMERTFSNDARTWTNVLRDNTGAVAVTTSEHGGDDSATWTGTSHKDGVKVHIRGREQRDAGALHLVGEVSADGKTFTKQYDLSCTK
jgi:hypothetical protein